MAQKEGGRVERLVKRLNIEPDVVMGAFQVDIRGRHRVKMGGVSKILLYSDTEIRVRIGNERVSVVGQRLECMSFCNGLAVIVGRVDGVVFVDAEAGV